LQKNIRILETKREVWRDYF